MIRAIIRNGSIHAVDPLPEEWSDGQELVVDEAVTPIDIAALNQWKREMDEASAAIPVEEHQQLLKALAEGEAES